MNQSLFATLQTAQAENVQPNDDQWYQAYCQKVEETVAAISYLPPKQVKRFREACFFMYDEHKAQRRRSGEPYAFHPLAVAGILAEVNFDADTLIAGLLHDVIEDVENPDGSKKWNTETLAAVPFVGKEVAEIVEGVTKIEKIDHITTDSLTKERREAHTIVKTILATSRDIRVIMVKLADRLHNLRTMGAMKPASQRKKARETLAVYAPIAARLGMETLRLRLTELSYRYAYPRLYARAKKHLDEQKPKVLVTNEEIAEELETQLSAVGVGIVKVSVREPLVQHALIELKRLGNVDAIEYRRLLRVVVKTEADCYLALGVLHRRFRHVNRSIMDYIAQPKDNGYRSLDTQLFGKKGGFYDGVIRTEEMHTLAQTGAAGAFLKAYFAAEDESSDNLSQPYEGWFKNLVEIEQSLDTDDEFYDELKADLRPNDISVYTPKGEIKFFPQGATPIDFAYSVHSALGNSAERALVNSQYVPLNYQLKDGDRVRIIRGEDAKPNPTWLRFAKTPRARGSIRQYFNRLADNKAIDHGRQLLKTLLNQFQRPMPEEWPETILQELFAKYDGIDSLDDLYLSIGRGHRLPTNVVYDLQKALLESNTDSTAHVTDQIDQIDDIEEAYFNQTDLFGELALPCEFCMPVPGDDVIVIYSKAKGMVIHNALCRMTHDRHVQNEDIHYFRWHANDTLHKAHLVLTVLDKPGVLAKACDVIADADSNIASADVTELDGQNSKIDLRLFVLDANQLNTIIQSLQRQPDIIKVERINYSKEI